MKQKPVAPQYTLQKQRYTANALRKPSKRYDSKRVSASIATPGTGAIGGGTAAGA